ncbi:MAG TPA: SRPBCC domain-containing protein [Candidatus Bathyarchaeia archaeon]|nr:SRPBCC domain-containing protein [Candidatus Bathyarchaeia archaeon]
MNARFASHSLLLMLLGLALPGLLQAETKELKTGAFQIVHELILPASPEAVYDAATGDISGWWDHHVSTHPKKLYIEARPGGGFWEIFNDSGDGVLHATVIYAERGRALRFTGPLGLSGQAIDMVTTWEFFPDPAGTKMRLTCNVSGQMEDGLEKILDGVWHHFLVERLKPYIESGAYKSKTQR